MSVCHRFYTIYQTSYSILKCLDHACNGVFISTIKNVVSDILLLDFCPLKSQSDYKDLHTANNQMTQYRSMLIVQSICVVLTCVSDYCFHCIQL